MTMPRSRPTVRLLFAASLVLAGAAPATVRAQGLDAARRICRSVLRTEPGQAQDEGCVESLSGTLRSLGQGRAIQAAHEACLGQGLASATPALAECTLGGAEAQAAAAVRTSAASAPPTPEPGGSKSWFSISNGDRFRREQLACARLGLDPVSGAFDSCVAGLRATLFELDNPSN